MNQASTLPPSSTAPSTSPAQSFSSISITNISHPSVLSAFHQQSWIHDSGATDHMISSISFFTSPPIPVNIFVKLPNDSCIQVTHKGTIRLSDSLVLIDVLYVPTFTFNLVSISKLTTQLSCFLIFLHGFYYTQDLFNWRMIGVAKHSQGLYHLL